MAIGVVTKLIESKDKQIRGAVVRTANGSEPKRPVSKLFPVEMNEEIRKERQTKDLASELTNMDESSTDKIKDPECIPVESKNSKTESSRSKRTSAVVGERNRRTGIVLIQKIDQVNLPGECEIYGRNPYTAKPLECLSG